MIPVDFDYLKDTDPGKDPDSFSKALNQHHQVMWSKPLPSGKVFNLEKEIGAGGKLLLVHRSEIGEFCLSSDALVHPLFFSRNRDKVNFDETVSYRNRFPWPEIQARIPEVVREFWAMDLGIACYTIFPAKQVNRKNTINQKRGFSGKICDRFDLTLECIRRFYENRNQDHPLAGELSRYASFFDLFGSFEGYVRFFHFQGLLNESGGGINFWLPFDDFQRSPLPQSVEEYITYKEAVCSFVLDRRRRIIESF
jgi:hypothetical protein